MYSASGYNLTFFFLADSVSVSISNMTRRLPRKSMLGTRNGRRDSMFPLLPDATFSATTSEIFST